MRLVLTTLCFAFVLSAFAEQDPDRRQNYDDSKKKAQDGNQNQLQPDMMQHIQQAAQHMQKAQEAEQQKNPQQAQQEQQMAAMEQAKAQQLQQQIQANDKSAQDNQQGSNKVQDDSGSVGKQQNAANQDNGKPIRQSDSYNRASTTISNNGSPASAAASPDPGLPSDELANLSAAQVIARPKNGISMDENAKVNAPPVSEIPAIGYAKDLSSISKVGNSASGPDPAQAQSVGSTGAPAGLAIDAGGLAQSRLLASSPSSGEKENNEFWKSAREMTGDSSPAKGKEDGFSLLALRGAKNSDKDKNEDEADGNSNAKEAPGHRLSDQAFWKKVGNQPKECQVTGKKNSAATQRQTRCLRQARRKIEQRWHQRPTAQVASSAKQPK